MVVSEVERHCKALEVYGNKDAVDKFLKCLETELEYIREKLHFGEPMRISNDEEKLFKDTVNCHLCRFERVADRFRNHCHLIGQFRWTVRYECYWH